MEMVKIYKLIGLLTYNIIATIIDVAIGIILYRLGADIFPTYCIISGLWIIWQQAIGLFTCINIREEDKENY